MRTITFYSYKGGVGRTLAMANVAKWLSEFNKKVCMIDFDLEAPGLHFKFQQQLKSFEFKRGIVDYIHDFVVTKEVPKTILDCVHTFKTSSKNPDIHFIPAGNTSSPEYWKKLSAISWNDLFYKEESEGVPFFLDLKEKIYKELDPDFLLVDSRTGISEISGITMSLYADKIVIVAANNDENLFGARDIIKSISNPENNFFDKTPEIIFVLSRIPYPEKPIEKTRETKIVEDARRKINFKKEDEILLIHSDRELEVKESLKIGFGKEKKIPIAEDYLLLFNKLTLGILGPEEIEKFNIIKEAELLAQTAEERISPNDKIELLHRAISLQPDNDNFYLKIGEAYYNKGDYENALSNFNYGITLNNTNYDLYYNRGFTYSMQKKFILASSDFEKALEINPNDRYSYLGLSAISDELGNYDNTILYSEKVLEIDPDNSTAYNWLAVSYRKKKKYELAFKNVYKALELNPRSGYAYSTLAEINSDKDNHDEFYRTIELALIFGCNVQELLEDKAYKPYKDTDRFKKLLEKYNNKDSQFGIDWSDLSLNL